MNQSVPEAVVTDGTTLLESTAGVKRSNRDLAAPGLALAGGALVAGAAVGGFVARRRKRASQPTADARTVARRVREAPWTGELHAIAELLSPDYVGHDPAEAEPIVGLAGLQASVERYVAAFPDGAVTIDAQFTEGDTVVTRWTARGTHTGDLAGIAPTGKEVTVSGITVSRVESGKIVEEWTSWDRLGLLVQLDAVAEPARA